MTFSHSRYLLTAWFMIERSWDISFEPSIHHAFFFIFYTKEIAPTSSILKIFKRFCSISIWTNFFLSTECSDILKPIYNQVSLNYVYSPETVNICILEKGKATFFSLVGFYSSFLMKLEEIRIRLPQGNTHHDNESILCWCLLYSLSLRLYSILGVTLYCC